LCFGLNLLCGGSEGVMWSALTKQMSVRSHGQMRTQWYFLLPMLQRAARLSAFLTARVVCRYRTIYPGHSSAVGGDGFRVYDERRLVEAYAARAASVDCARNSLSCSAGLCRIYNLGASDPSEFSWKDLAHLGWSRLLFLPCLPLAAHPHHRFVTRSGSPGLPTRSLGSGAR
jgi:hypothetical protein